MYMYVGIRRTHAIIDHAAPFTSASLGHKPTAKQATTRVVVQPVPFVHDDQSNREHRRQKIPTPAVTRNLKLNKLTRLWV